MLFILYVITRLYIYILVLYVINCFVQWYFMTGRVIITKIYCLVQYYNVYIPNVDPISVVHVLASLL